MIFFKIPVGGPCVLMHVTTKKGYIQDTVDGSEIPNNQPPGIE